MGFNEASPDEGHGLGFFLGSSVGFLRVFFFGGLIFGRFFGRFLRVFEVLLVLKRFFLVYFWLKVSQETCLVLVLVFCVFQGSSSVVACLKVVSVFLVLTSFGDFVMYTKI